jgi:hypothetical protein
MTVTLEPPEQREVPVEETDVDTLDRVDLGSPAPATEDAPDAVSPVMLALTVVSGALSAGGAAWMIGGVFRGGEARLVAFLGVLIGAGLVFLGTRGRIALATYLPLPVALLVGALLMGSSSGSGTSSLPSLVKDAVTSSQLLQPPIDFAPGWRLILVVLLSLLTSAAISLALSTNRPRLAVAVPAPLTVAAALVQPGSTAVVTSAVSVGFVMMALATSYAADGVGESFDRRFEVRRLGRSLLAGVLLVAGLIAASQVSFLFPDQDTHRVVPPRRPPVSPPLPDVPLYSVKGELPGPLRVGVIDVYDLKEQAWLLPPVDNRRLVREDLPADLPGAPVSTGSQDRITVTVRQAEGHVMPTIAGAHRVEGDATADWDPRTQTLSLASRPVFTGLHYDVVANQPPTGAQLSAAKDTIPADIRQFLQAPPVPPAVEALLDKAPAQPYARLQRVREALYAHFTAAGAGKPTDVSADRVVELLAGGKGVTGNPYELTASEALLARWAGIPARMGFGYFHGTEKDGELEFRPADAATYLEVYFAPYGWVPIVGTPPKAQQSLSDNQRDSDPNIQASKDLGIDVYLPVRLDNKLPLYVYARYYLMRVLPVLAGVGLLLLVYPVALKRLRRRRRAAWAAARGPAGTVAAAYCSLRDRMIDLALPGRGMTPLELLETVEDDEEHAELAWLVTRGLWGDLRGSLTADDAETARRLAESVGDRLAKAQPETARLLARVSRASLRSPYSREVPNAWWRIRIRGRMPRVRPVLLLRRLRPGVATSLVVVLCAIGLGGCSSGGGTQAEPDVPFPTRLAPTLIAGMPAHEENRAAQVYLKGAADKNVIVSDGKVLSFSRDGLVQAALQVAQLKRGYVSTDDEVVEAITRSIGDVKPLRAEATHDLFTMVKGSQRLYLWFPTVKSMALLVVRSQITAGAAEALARALITYEDGGDVDEAALAAAFTSVPPPSVAPPPGPTSPASRPPSSTSPEPSR